MTKRIQIYTDGSCLNNPGPGGWAYLVVNEGKILAADCGYIKETTNNQMELEAVLAALEAYPARRIELFSDSSYVVRSINEWLAGWIKSGFRGKANVQMWQKYSQLAQNRDIKAVWVKAHAGNSYNELCDLIANTAAHGKVEHAKAKCANLIGHQTDDISANIAIIWQENDAKAPARKYAKLEQKLGHIFQDEALVRRALCHKSTGKLNNERLEFLGDAVMDLVLAHMLFRDDARYNEGDLSKLRAALVNEKSFAKIAQYLGLGEFLELSAAEEKGGGRNKPSLLSDAFEAIMGVVYLEAGFRRVCEIGERIINENFSHIGVDLIKDYKTKLQELTQARYGEVPEYRVLSSSGPDHAKSFEIGIYLCGKLRAKASGRSKKEAEQAAAEQLYKELSE